MDKKWLKWNANCNAEPTAHRSKSPINDVDAFSISFLYKSRKGFSLQTLSA